MRFKSEKFEIRSHFSKVNGRKIHYLTCGRGDPFVFLHASLSTARTFTEVIKYLAKYYKVYAPDFPGHGLSDEPEGRPTLKESSNLIAHWIKQERLTDFVLAGVSMGGTVAVYLAPEIDDLVRGYVLIEPYLGPTAFLFPGKVIRFLRLLTLFFNKILPTSLGERVWSSKDLLVFLMTNLNPFEDEVEKNRPMEQKWDILSCATYKTFWHTMDVLLNLDLSDEKNVSKKHAVLVMSSADKSLSYKKTLKGFKIIFPNLKAIKIELAQHYPVEPITVRYIETHYPSLLKEIGKDLKNE